MMKSFEDQKREIELMLIPLTQEQEEERRYMFLCRSCTDAQTGKLIQRSCKHAYTNTSKILAEEFIEL